MANIQGHQTATQCKDHRLALPHPSILLATDSEVAMGETADKELRIDN